ncbi:MAG TPA: molybdopterin-binding protein, partial [Acidobacteriota bacterium]
MSTAEIIAIGSELLSPFRVDTNSLYLTRSLEERGIKLVAKSVIGDDLHQLVNAFRVAFERSDIIICSGGIGPTLDDLTKEALASFLQLPLEFHADIFERIEARFRKRGFPMPAINRTQAMIPSGATILQNQHGTAPGVYMKANNKQVFLLPGVPFELQKMWELECLTLLKTEEPFLRNIFHVAMLPESTVDEMLRPVTGSLQDIRYTILASPADIEIHLLGPQSASDELISASAEVRAILGNRLYAEDQAKMEEVVGRLLKERKRSVAVAESCTGGMLAQRFTSVPGSS